MALSHVRNVSGQFVIGYPVNYRRYTGPLAEREHAHNLWRSHHTKRHTKRPLSCGQICRSDHERSWQTRAPSDITDENCAGFKQNNFLIGLFEDEEERNLIKRWTHELSASLVQPEEAKNESVGRAFRVLEAPIGHQSVSSLDREWSSTRLAIFSGRFFTFLWKHGRIKWAASSNLGYLPSLDA